MAILASDDVLTKSLSRSARVKCAIKRKIQGDDRFWNGYQRLKLQFKRLLLFKYFAYDAKNNYKYMFWGRSGNLGRRRIASEIAFNYHKIEKALSLPGEKRLFGLEPVGRLLFLLQKWKSRKFSTDDPIFIGAIDALSAYRKFVKQLNLDPENRISPQVDGFLEAYRNSPEFIEPTTPMRVDFTEAESANYYAQFEKLVALRRSVRNFSMRPIEVQRLEQAVRLAQMSPSACNRQPCRIYLIAENEAKRELLSFQNGNRGFGHLIPVVAIITSDDQCFFDASERHQPYVDGGLFSMSFAYALQAQGISTCCLNWCVAPAVDVAVHRRFNIPDSERIIMLMAIGYASDETVVPRSHRKSLEQVLRVI